MIIEQNIIAKYKYLRLQKVNKLEILTKQNSNYQFFLFYVICIPSYSAFGIPTQLKNGYSNSSQIPSSFLSDLFL